MKLGFFGINLDAGAVTPEVAVRVASAAERAGWESVWASEHYVLPTEFAPPSPAPGDTPMLDPFVSLALVAGHTETLLLGTGVIVVPLHQPLALAKRVASLDRVAGGRLLFGVGVGYLEPEFDALDTPLANRGERMDDALAAMRAIWTEKSPTVDGGHFPFSGLTAEPRPVRRPGPPLHVGGFVGPAFRRAVVQGHGWYGFALDVAGTQRCIEGLRAAERQVARPADLPALEISVTPHPRLRVDRQLVDRFAALGVGRLVLLPPAEARNDPDRLLRWVEELPGALGP